MNDKQVVKQFLKEERGMTRPKLVKRLDKLFSDYMLKKHGKCFKCGGTKQLGVSHYFSRKHIGGRWSEENCDVACWPCHYYRLEHFKQPGEFYWTYMNKKLGKDGFQRLVDITLAINKFSMSDIKLLIKEYEKKI